MTPLPTYLENRRLLVDRALIRLGEEPEGFPAPLLEAMKYSLLAGGKRLRPILALAVGEAVGGDPDILLPGACALELIHTYSLIHDDLPAMDDDDFRRGRPTSHKAFGEATAILAGDALLTLAFQVLSADALAQRVNPGTLLRAINEIASAAGAAGMIGGQIVDVQSEGCEVSPATLEYIHTHKTGALIRASVRLGALLGGASGPETEALTRYGEKLGLGFQIVDDILDVIGEQEALGKRTGGDVRRKKATYPALMGLERAKTLARRQIEEAVAALAPLGPRARILKELAEYVGARIPESRRTS